MEDRMLGLIGMAIEEDETLLNKENIPKRVLVDSIYKILTRRLEGADVAISRQSPDRIKSMEYISIVGVKTSFDPSIVSELLKYVDGLEIYPRTDDKFCINLSFYNLYSKTREESVK